MDRNGKTMLNEENKDNITVDFHVNGMPLKVFKEFKNYTEDYRGNYSVTIQVLMERNKFLEYLMAGELGVEEMPVEYPQEEDEKKEDEVPTLG